MKKTLTGTAVALILSAGSITPAAAYDFELDFDNKRGQAQYKSPKEDTNLPSNSDSGLIKAYQKTGAGEDERLGMGNSVVEDD
jgi:hypothetical protein